MTATYDMTGSPEVSAWMREQGIDPTRATPEQCADAMNATNVCGCAVAARPDGRLQVAIDGRGLSKHRSK